MIACPNKKSKEWQSLSKELGEDKALLAFIRNNGEIPTASKARELVTNRGLLESIQNLPVLSESNVVNMLKTSGLITGEPIKEDGRDFYQIVPGTEEKFDNFTNQYGGVVDFQGDYVAVNNDSIESWNRIGNALSLKNKSVTELSKDFLSRIGVPISVQNDVIAKYGSNGIADFAERMVRIQSGKEDEALPEEALHFFLDMMPQDHEALVAALDKIRNTDTYKSTVEKYKNNPNYRTKEGTVRFDKIKKEALAKELAMQMKEKEKRGWVANIIKAIIDWIKGVKVQKEPMEILQDLFLSGDISLLNTNLQSSEMYNQLTDDMKNFYEAQIQTEEQKQTLEKLIAHSAKTKFDEASHSYTHAAPTGDVQVMKSVTKILGSDFYSEIENYDVMMAVITNFENEFPGVVDPFEEDAVKAQKLTNHVIDLISSGELTQKNLEESVGKKIGDLLFKASEAKDKTIFGTAVHSIAEAIILEKELDLDKVDPVILKFMDRKTLERLVYGTASQPGLMSIIREMRERGSVIVTELEMSNMEIGGKLDIIEIKKDGVVEIHDFKAKYLKNYGANKAVKKEMLDEYHSAINTMSSTGVKDEENTLNELIGKTRSAKQKYSQQLSIYKKMLMEAGVRVGGLHIIGIPYRLDEKTKKVSEIKIEKVDDIPYNADIAEYYFNFDPALDASTKGPVVLRQDERIKNIEDIKRDKLKEAFAKSLARVTQLFKKYGRTKNVDELYNLLVDSESKTNKLQLQKNQLEALLQNYDDVENFLTIQNNFLELIDSSSEIVEAGIKRFDDLKKLTPTDKEGASQKLNELMKVKDFLMGYQSMFKELLQYLDKAERDNPLVSKLNQLSGVIDDVRNEYIETITPSISAMLGDAFTSDLLDNIKREYNELIAAARVRGDKEREQSLIKERDGLPSQKVIEQTLKGNNGDVGWFFSKLMATVSNPDIVIAGVAKRLKGTLDRVRIKNKDLRDSLGKELSKRFAVYGRGADIKAINQNLVYVVEEFNPETGETENVLHFKSEFDEKLYNDYAKLKYGLKEALKGEDKDKIREARKEMRDFEKKYFQTGLTSEYYRLTKPLDTKVMYGGKQTTVRDIENGIRDQISNIERLYSQDDLLNGRFNDEHLKELQTLNEQKAQLREKLDEKGNPKTGDALKISEALEEYDKNKSKLYDSIELTEYFNRSKEKAKLQYGEGSEEYQKWLSNNTRLVISDDYYKEMEALMTEKAQLLGSISSDELNGLYKELRILTAPYKDKDGFIKGSFISEKTADKIKELQDKINDLQQTMEYSLFNGYTREEKDRLNALFYLKRNGLPYDQREMNAIMQDGRDRLAERLQNDPDLPEKMDRLKEINQLIFAMSSKQNTKYYYEELEKQERMFAEANNITYAELKKDREFYKLFKESDWYLKNHVIDTKVLYEDEETGERREATSEVPTYQWRRNMPVEKYITERPARHFTKITLRESYTDENGKEVMIQDKDNLDSLGRYKPKSNEDYLRENGTNHPYLNKDFVNLRTKYDNKSASEKEKIDYENLLFIHKQMLDSQENIEQSQRLGLAVPFLEKKTFERTVETRGENVKDKASTILEGIKRSVTRTKQDVDQEGIPDENNIGISKLATMDNNEVKFIPVRFSTKGDAENASYDVWGAVLNYLGSINRKSELEKELAFVNGVESILGEEANQPKSENKNMILNNIYKRYIPELEAKLNIGGNTRLEVLKSFINSVMYNEDYFKGYDVLGVNTQKAISTVMGLTSYTILGAAPFNWTVNWLSGNVQNIVEAAGGRNYTFKDFTSAKADIYGGGKYGSAIADMKEDYTKVGNLSFWGQIIEFYDPVQGEFENEYGHKTSFSGLKNIFHLGMFAGKVWGEWEIQMSSFIAFMKNHKVVGDKIMDKETFLTQKIGVDVDNLSPQEISARKLEALKEWDTLDTNLLDIHEMDKTDGKLKIKDKYKDVFQIGSQEFSDVVAKLHAMQKKLNGSYAKFDKTYAEKTSIGRMMFFFRKYFIPLGVARWGQRRVDYESMSVEQGFYLTFLQTVGKDLMKFRFNVVKNWNTYSDQEKRAIKKTLADVGIILGCIAAYSLLFGFNPDDKDRMKKLREKGWAAQAAVFLLLKVRSETEQFLPNSGVQEISRVYSNPSLVFSETTQYIKISNLLLMQAGNMIPGMDFNSDLYYSKKVDESGFKDQGDSKLVAAFMKTFVGYTGRTFNPVDAVKSFEYTQRLK